MQKKETQFRQRADRDIDTLPETFAESIQQQSIRGTPDKILCVKAMCACGKLYGQFVAIEFKSEYGMKNKSKSQALQDYKLSKIREAGGISIKAGPKEWNEAFKQLKSIRGQS